MDAIADGPFHPRGSLDFATFRAALHAAGYTPEAVEETKHAIRSTTRLTLAAIDHRLAESTPRNTLLRLFLLGQGVPDAAMRAAVAPMSAEQWLEHGFVWRDGDQWRATGRIDCRHDMLLLSDFFEPLSGRPPRLDHVMGLAGSTVLMGALAPRKSVESALDLCTGGGFHAMLATAHAERVVATDVGARALNFAAANAELNGITNIEFRLGSFFEPVKGEKFELIVSNPPYVISPGTRMIFRDGGLGGDAVTEHMVKGSAAHLEEGGFAIMLTNWFHAGLDDWQERPASWLRDTGCDAWWLRFDQDDPLTYAVHWLQQSESGDGESSPRLLAEWLAYFKEIGAGRLSLGVVILRKRSGVKNWLRWDDVPGTTSVQPCGDQVERVFDSEDLLQSLADERDLLTHRFQLHPEHRIQQQMVVSDGGCAMQDMELHVTRGIDFPARLDSPMLKFLALLDGTRTLDAACHEMAAALDAPFDAVVPTGLEITKRLMRSGLVSAVR